VDEILLALSKYRVARQELLRALGLSVSNRDPIPELAERLVAQYLNGELAPDRVQKDYDLTVGTQRVQVRSLTNSANDRWINEHLVTIVPGGELYALVIVEDLRVSAILVFPNDLSSSGRALGKRHPNQSATLKLTRRDFQKIIVERDAMEALGMRIWTPATS
jgi:hypothetical protein